MLIACYAPALVAATSRGAPRLGPLFLAAQLTDIAFRVLALLGVEHYAVEPLYTAIDPLYRYDVPWSHSLLGTLGWAALFAIGVRLARGSREAAWVGAAVVALHWPIALVFHAPDLTVAGGLHRLGLGLWNHPYLAMPAALLAALPAFTFYANRTRARDWRGTVMLALLTLVTIGFQIADWLLSGHAREAIDPAPAALSYDALAVYVILTVLAWWTGTLRDPVWTRPARAGTVPIIQAGEKRR